MEGLLVTVHVTTAVLAAGVLFAVSLAVVAFLRVQGESQRESVRAILKRVHLGGYYPMLGIALVTGLGQAWASGAFGQGRWLHWKLLVVVILIGLGLLTGQALRSGEAKKPVALAIHIAVFFLTALIVFLAVRKPF